MQFPGRTRRTTIIVLALIGAVGTVGVGYAAIPAADGVISGCFNASSNPSGQLRLIDAEAGAKCGKNEKPLTFNQTGPAGSAGPAGADGADGAQGIPGPQGPAGPSDAYRQRARNVPVGPFSDNWAKFATLELPAGHYSLTASLDLANREESPQFANCRLTTNDQWVRYVRLDEALTAELIVLQDLLTLGAPGTVGIECSSPARSEVLTAELVAIRVGAIHP